MRVRLIYFSVHALHARAPLATHDSHTRAREHGLGTVLTHYSRSSIHHSLNAQRGLSGYHEMMSLATHETHSCVDTAADTVDIIHRRLRVSTASASANSSSATGAGAAARTHGTCSEPIPCGSATLGQISRVIFVNFVSEGLLG